MKYYTKDNKVYDLNDTNILFKSDIWDEYAISQDLGATIIKYNPINDERKIKIMIDSSKGKNTQCLAWPQEMLYDENGRFAGYTKHHLIGKTLSEAFNDHYLSWEDRVALARNLSLAVKNIKDMGHIFGQFNCHSFTPIDLVRSPKEYFYIIYNKNKLIVSNCRTLQIYDTDRRIIGSGGLTSDDYYSSPENIDHILNTPTEEIYSHPFICTKESDYFSLAIIIFKLLSYGTHPFMKGRTWDYEIGILFGKCIFFPETCEGYKVGKPKTFQLNIDEVFPPEICELFKRTFVYGHKVPKLRATADEWYSALSDLLQNLKQCEHNQMHYYHRSLQECPWCLNEKRILKNRDSSLGNTVRKLFGHR